MTDLISKSRLKNELSKIPSEMGLIKKAQVIQAIDKQKTQDSKQTNADRIRNMSDEELAEFLITFKNAFGEEYEGEVSCMQWLQSEAE